MIESIPLLATKLYLPTPRPKVVLRPHLIARLNEGRHGKLTLISAPAGFGKTTLVSEWLAAPSTHRIPDPLSAVAWLSLDECDSDLARFLTYLVAALQTIAPQIGARVMGMLQSAQLPPVETMLTALLNDITTFLDNFVLVLDDYHVIDAASRGYPPLGAVDEALTFLLEHLPPQMHLVITTREDPQLPLARLRARGQMTELRASDLRFTPTEAAGFLNQVMGLELSVVEVAILETRTEGWIAGLQLAALSMRGREDIAEFVQVFAGDNRYIVDYLVEEVLQRQPERVRRFLLQTAMLDRLSGPLCDAVTDFGLSMIPTGVGIIQNSQMLLEQLERGNLFVVPLDDKRHWFRYHHLFADVLAAYALQEQPTQVPIMHQRASAWYAANGWPADAIRHALAAKDFPLAAGLIEQAWPAMDGRFQTATWLGWAKAVPDEVVRARPVLTVAYAWALLNGGDLEAAETHLLGTERWLDTGVEKSERLEALLNEIVIVDETQFRNLPASIATAHAYLTQARGDIPGSVKYGQRALDLLPEGDHLRRGPAAAMLGLAQWASGDLEAAYRALAAAMIGFQKVGNLHFATSVTSGLADIRTVQGRLCEAIGEYIQALQLVLAQGELLIRGTANLYLGLSELYHEQGNQEVAIQHLLRSEELGEQTGLPDWRYRLCCTQARFKQTVGDLAGALDRLAEAERYYRRTPVPDLRPLAALKTRVWVAQGRLSEALRWVQEQGLSVDDELSFLREFEHITLARVLMAQHECDQGDGSIHAAMAFLARLLQAAEVGGRTGSMIEILVLQALAHATQDNMRNALAPLKRALTLAKPEGYVRMFVDEGLPMARLLSAMQGVMPAIIGSDYSGKLLAVFAVATKDEGQTSEPSPSSLVIRHSSLVEPLSERELEVLRLLGTELNGPEIARRLMVSLHTMRTHTKNIYNKLGVNDRRAAVRRGEELGLL